ncbi:MAG: hypothetical protein ABI895_11080 [Deltaproteobacteria bacterium]
MHSPAASAPPAEPAAAPASALERASLPSYFTVEVAAAGALFADGAALASSLELEPVARAAAARGSFEGAVLFGDARSGAAFAAALEVLRRAGFATLVEVRRSAPVELSALARAERERARRGRQRLIAAGVIEGDAPVAPSSGRPPAETVARERAPAVELQTVGLYLAGAANIESTRRQLVKLFERNFGAFRRCHADAPAHTENASFGVDLLVPKEGGRAKVRQTRTRLAGSGFRNCMERVFQAIRFEPLPSGRPEIVSYSVLFRPAKR